LPAFFIGHGSPMNAIESNAFTREWQRQAETLPRPRAILVVSAHWLTRGTQITAMASPKTIHDFGGFPQELFQVQYPAPGSPDIAAEVKATLANTVVAEYNQDWGLDHGTWSILTHMYPKADIPVLQLSIDAGASASEYLKIGSALAPLRNAGILIIGSGNIVHNLRLVDWARIAEPNFAFDWAARADASVQNALRQNKWPSLAQFDLMSEDMKLAINSAEHYIPLLYVVGSAKQDEVVEIFNDTAVGGSLTMTCVRFG
jgi:4,5-DOPA dioxygenase extradiol